MRSENNLRMQLKEALDNLWSRVKALASGLDSRVTALEEGGGGGSGGDANVIEAISLNGTNVPPDASKRVSLQETDPTVPSWAKAASKPTYTASEVGALPDTTTFVTGVKGNVESAYRTGQVNITPANIGAKATQTAVTSPAASGNALSFIDTISQNEQGVIAATKKTVSGASTTSAGLMSAEDKSKLNGIAAGAQVNSITGVKGNSESSYRTGNVNLTPANVGAVAKSGDTMTGNLTLKNPTADTATHLYVQTVQNSGAIHLYASAEGGNVQIVSPNGKQYEIDAYNDDAIRIFGWDDSGSVKSMSLNRKTGVVTSSGGFSGNLSGNATNVTGTVAVNHGGTNSTTAQGARANLDVPYTAYVDGSTWEALYAEMLKITRGGAGIFLLSGAAANVLSNGKITSQIIATIFRSGTSDTSGYLRIMAASDSGLYHYSWYVQITSSTARTTGTVYRFTGTAL